MSKKGFFMQNKYITVVIFILTIYLSGCSSDNGSTNSSLTMEGDTKIIPPVMVKRDLQVKISDTQIEVYWKSNTNVASYILEFGDKQQGFQHNISLNAQTTRYIATDLKKGHTYMFRLMSILLDGTEQVSQVLEVTAATATATQLQTDIGPNF
jgi:hypothetical protein